VLADGGATLGITYFGAFSAARLLHSYAYVAGKQPWRTICFAAGALATGVLMLNDAWLLFGVH
jgi:uncharacterized MAPEG superfamily protein